MRNLNPEPKIVIGNFDSWINISYICSDKTIFINKIIKSMQRKCILSVAFVFAALSLANCQREPAVQPVAEADKTIPSYHIPREKALAELNSFLADVDANNTTRGGKIRQIKDVTPILGDKFQNATRVSEDEAAAAIDTLLYLVNFEDEEGYAVLSAADFLAPIIAVMDQGSIDSSMIGNVAGTIWDFDDDCCVVYDEDEGSDDWEVIVPPSDSIGLINPLSHSHEITRTSETSSAVNHNLRFVLRTISDYCEFKLIDHQNTGDDNSGGNSGNDQGSQGTIILGQVQPMLRTEWKQTKPFNSYCPETNNTEPELNGRAPAGCTAVALGQIMAYHQYPTEIITYWPNWNIISNVTDASTSAQKQLVARLLSILGTNYIDMTYKANSSSSGIHKVSKAMKRMGYRNVSVRIGYNEQEILSYLLSDRPVYIRAVSPKSENELNDRVGHAWVIDGYIKRQRGTQIETLVHCNMGNGTNTNGYYASKVFDTTKVMDEDGNIVPVTPPNPQFNFCKNYKTIRYDKPTN